MNHDFAGPAGHRSAAQWLKLGINSTGDPLTVETAGRVYDDCATDPFWYYFPSLMVNATGDMVMGFSGSSVYAHIGGFYSWRLVNGTMANRAGLLKKGEEHFDFQPVGNDERWGDYSATTLDPSDSLSFWTVQEYSKQHVAPSQLPGENWGTWIGKVNNPP